MESRPEGAAADVARARSVPGGARRPRSGAGAQQAAGAKGGSATGAGPAGVYAGAADGHGASPAAAGDGVHAPAVGGILRTGGADVGIAHAGADAAAVPGVPTAADVASGRPAGRRRSGRSVGVSGGEAARADGAAPDGAAVVASPAETHEASGSGGIRKRAGASGKRRGPDAPASPAADAGDVAHARGAAPVARKARTAAEAALAAGEAAYGDDGDDGDGAARSAAAIRRRRKADRETAGAVDGRADAAPGGDGAAAAHVPAEGSPAASAPARERAAAAAAPKRGASVASPKGAPTAADAARIPEAPAAGARAAKPGPSASRPGTRRRPARPGEPALKRRGPFRRAGRKPGGKAGGAGSAEAAKARMQSRRAWLTARANAAGASARSAASAAKGKAAAAASSAAAPLAGILAGAVCFMLATMAASQAVSALLGFWENEASLQAVEGLPPYISYGMVEAAVECQEEYGHPAGCTLAQVVVESGVGDALSGLAERDANLFGIKWSPSFLGCPEVAGKSSWGTQEEVDGDLVDAMADFTVFRSPEDCIRFRSRVVLAGGRYAGNELIREAIGARDSDMMAEGLADAGWATSSSYADALKSVMDLYGLRRFDALSLADFHAGGAAADGNAVVEAARTQLGVPYVWGGTAPGVGLDCSGLTQWCYAQAGISIPRNSEDQAAAGAHVPLSQARPGDVLWRPGHVAIYIGGDEYIHEPQAGDVCRVASGISYFTCAVRF